MTDFIAIDTETGGLDAAECALLSIAAVPSWDAEPFSVTVLPVGRVEEAAARVNGYSPELWKKKGSVPEKVAAWEFRRWLDLNGKGWQRRELAAHNAGFDALFVLALEHRTGIDLELPKLWHCTKLKMQRLRELGVLPAKGGNRLDDLGELSGFWDLEPRAKEHDALQDARACRHGLLWLREKERGAAL